VKHFTTWLAGELAGWKKSEVLWILFCLAATAGIALSLDDSIMGLTVAVTGILYTLLAGKGKISCYLFGIVNVLFYGWISLEQRLYGEVMLNWGWYLPMMFAGWFCWKRHLDKVQTIRKTALSPKARLFYIIFTLAGIAIYAIILREMNDSQPWVDSATTVLSITAMILTVKRCADQWLIWTTVNILSIWMWIRACQLTGGSMAVLAMWLLSLANGIIFYIQWNRDIKQCQKTEQI
jgi:nicotinamide mononucleotide transporter